MPRQTQHLRLSVEPTIINPHTEELLIVADAPRPPSSRDGFDANLPLLSSRQSTPVSVPSSLPTLYFLQSRPHFRSTRYSASRFSASRAQHDPPGIGFIQTCSSHPPLPRHGLSPAISSRPLCDLRGFGGRPQELPLSPLESAALQLDNGPKASSGPFQ